MADNDFSKIGDDVKSAVQKAIDSGDFTKLNESVTKSVSLALGQFEKTLNNIDFNKIKKNVSTNSKDNLKEADEDTEHEFNYKSVNPNIDNRHVLQKNSINKLRIFNTTRFSATFLPYFGAISAISAGSIFFTYNALKLILSANELISSFNFYIPNILLLLAGAAGITFGSNKIKLLKEFKRIIKILSGREFCQIEEIEKKTHIPHKNLIKDIKRMFNKGWFKQGALDDNETCLMVTDEAYSTYIEAQKQYEARIGMKTSYASEALDNDRDLPPVIREGREFLIQIKKSNDAIPGIEISEKITKLEVVVERIFARVEENPQYEDELRKFMKYYLPTTVKLLKAYENLEKEEVQGENIIKSKKEIEKTLDTINIAFENLLDSFFENTAVDIKSDISVMETLMAQEGLLHSKVKDKVNRNN